MIYFGELPRERLPFRPVCSVVPQGSWEEASPARLQTMFMNVLTHHEYPGQCFFPLSDVLSAESEEQALGERVRWTLAYYIALGLDPRKAVVYRQSDLPEVFELAFLISRISGASHGMDVALIAADIVGVKGSCLLDGGGRTEEVVMARELARRVYRQLGVPDMPLDTVRPTTSFQDAVSSDPAALSALRDRAARLFDRPQPLENLLRDGARTARFELVAALRTLKSRVGLATRGNDAEERAFLRRCADAAWLDFVAAQRRNGRAALPTDFRRFARSMYTEAKRFASGSTEESARSVADLVSCITYPFAREHADGYPTYYSYADIGVLDWYVRRGPAGILGQLQHALQGVRALLEGHRRFEAAPSPAYAATRIPVERLPARLEILDGLLRDVEILSHTIGVPPSPRLPHEAERTALKLHDLVAQPSLALQTFCPIPQTTYHDEVLFLSTVQISELLFWAMRQCSSATVTAESPRETEIFLYMAAWFAKLLYDTFLVLRTMPNDYFAEFRDYTGKASAVQSRSYQIFDILYRGLDARKLAHLAEYEHLRDLMGWGHSAMRSLSSMLATAPEGVQQAARDLDATLLQWRGLHLAFAKAYLPANIVGTGGTSGAEYLRRFLKNGLFGELANAVQELDVDAEAWDSLAGLGVSPPDRVQGSFPTLDWSE
jgi:tryptophan 2,3-dioxygenase